MASPSVRLELRAALAVVALGAVLLVIIFVELCGREDVAQSGDVFVQGPTATTAPPFTPGPSPTPGPEPTEVVLPGAEDRDATRVQDLAALEEALERYRESNGAYPDSEGNIQTLCAFIEADVGCELDEFLTPRPEDPLGDPGVNGYWYASNGSDYVLFAQRESEIFPGCEEHPDHLSSFDSVYCARGP